MSLSKVCLIIDFDGFFVNRKFYAREFGFYSLTKLYRGSYRFRLNHLLKRLTNKDWQHINLCTNTIHGLSFQSVEGEEDLFPPSHLMDLVLNEYNASKTKDKFFVAFKGGHVERDVLKQLEIPHLNLELYRCPKFKDLPRPSAKDCGYHQIVDNDKLVVHCPAVKCFAYAMWLTEKL